MENYQTPANSVNIYIQNPVVVVLGDFWLTSKEKRPKMIKACEDFEVYFFVMIFEYLIRKYAQCNTENIYFPPHYLT